MRVLVLGGLLLATATGSQAQEESCVGALQSRADAGQAVMNALPRPDADCSELKARLDAFVAAETALKKSDRAVKRACPSGDFVRGDADRSVRVQFVVEAARKRLEACPGEAKR